jgi:hypothetical protein
MAAMKKLVVTVFGEKEADFTAALDEVKRRIVEHGADGGCDFNPENPETGGGFYFETTNSVSDLNTRHALRSLWRLEESEKKET